jgi:hypothetical protein
MATATGYAEMFEWEDGNPNNEDRAGYTVVLGGIGGDKVRIAKSNERPIGVVGGDNTSVSIISGGSPQEWHGKHKRDEFNRLMWERQLMVEWVTNGYRHWYESDRVPDELTIPDDAKYHGVWPDTGLPLQREIQTEEYVNPSKAGKLKAKISYLPRWERKEWAIVVLIGRTMVREDCASYNSNWKRLKKSSPGSNVAEWLIR